jgi:hypothetical protein
MIDAGLTIYDNTFNEDMQDTFVIVMEAYNQSGGDTSRIDHDHVLISSTIS